MSVTIGRRELLARGLRLSVLAAALPLAVRPASADSPRTRAVDPDPPGLRLPPGFAARVIARAGEPVPGTGFRLPLPLLPDGAGCFPDPETGGWILVFNSEVPAPWGEGGAYAIRFRPDGASHGAYPVLGGTRRNCAGGATPWGTWISCEEWDFGACWECHPLGQGRFGGRVYPARHAALGIFSHESAAVDAARRTVYLTEDVSDGRLYRMLSFDDLAWDESRPGDLSQGLLQVAVVHGEDPRRVRRVTWAPVPDPQYTGEVALRYQVPEATVFRGGEGCAVYRDTFYFVTKKDNRVWAYDLAAETLRVIYDAADYPEPGAPLTGVDNLAVSRAGHVLVAEDGGDMEIMVLAPDGAVFPLLQLTGDPGSELTGLAFSPDATRLYFSSQRGGTRFTIPGRAPGAPRRRVGGGVLYELRRLDGAAILAQ